MTDSLRMRVVEAGARAFHDPGVEPHDDDRHLAALILDAMLDCLTENADEWASKSIDVWADIDNLVAVLREDR